MTKAEQKTIDALVTTIERKLSNIESGMRFEAMVRLHVAKRRLSEAQEEYRRAKAICDQMQRARAKADRASRREG
jgi:hypothetical protein